MYSSHLMYVKPLQNGSQNPAPFRLTIGLATATIELRSGSLAMFDYEVGTGFSCPICRGCGSKPSSYQFHG
jgi:hypothetical protein